MAQWLTTNEAVLRLLIDVTLLVIWLTYLQVFLASYRRQKRPKVLIDRGGAPDLRARCLVSNMSEAAFYIERIVVCVEGRDGMVSSGVTDAVNTDEDKIRADPRNSTHQGPLQAGCYIDVGSFQSLVERALDSNGGGTLQTLPHGAGLEVLVAGTYGAESLLVGSRRRFEIVGDGEGRRVRPCTLRSHQITSRRERKRLARELANSL